MKKQSTIIFLLPVTFLLFFSFAYSQNKGQIQGTITDSTTGDALYGANVIIEGTSLGAASDINGNYKIYNVPADSLIVIVRYIGYQQKEIPVKIIGGSTIEVNVPMLSEVIKGETVVVTAQAFGQKGAINQQLTSNTIINVVSAEKIHQLPDDNAATAISRLPGISLMNGDQVVIRGIQAKLNSVLLNGIEIPSTDMTNRATNLGFISSNMLSSIEVTKALTPDMDANAIGGVVNLRLREAPSDFHFDVFTQGNYNTLDRTTDNYKIWASASYRFFEDKLGVFLQGNADKSDIGQDVTTANFQLLGSGSTAYGEAPYQMQNYVLQDQWNVINNGGVSLILDYLLPQGKIVFQNTYANNLSNNTAYRNTYGLDNTQAQYGITRDKYGKDLMINALQSEYNFGDIKTELSLSHSFANKYTRIRYGDVGQPMYFYNTNSHPYGYDDNGKRIDFLAQRQFLTLDDALKIPIDASDAPDAAVQGWVVGREEAFDQHVYNAILDFTVPVTFSEDVSSKFKLGGKFTRSTRENDVEAQFNGAYDTDYYTTTSNFFPNHPNLTPQNPVLFRDLWYTDYERGNYYLNGDYDFQYAYDRDLMDRYMEASMEGWQPARHATNSERDDFNGSEVFSAGYLMGEFNIGPRITLIAGARFEHYNMDYHGKFVYVTHSVYGYGKLFDTLNTVNRNDDNLFPNVQLRYKFTEWSDIRLAYTKGISRPDYNAIMPSIYIEPGGAGQAGNTELIPAISTNYDLYLSFYTNEIGLFTVGGFYKKINDVFFQTNIFYQNLSHYNVSFPDSATWAALGVQPNAMPTASQQITTFLNNPEPAYVRGIELDWQTNFWYLPKPFNSLVFNINYTRAWSDMDYQQVRNQTITVQDPITHRPKNTYVTTDTVRNARLLYQGDHALNIALGIDYKGFSGRISFNLQGNVITSVGARPEEDQFTGDTYRWDFMLKQDLPLEGLSIQLNGINIFNNAVYTYRNFRRAVDGPVQLNEASIAYSPRIFQFNIRYSL
jgi:TonB-dependent receptor